MYVVFVCSLFVFLSLSLSLRTKRRVAKSWQRAQITLAITRARLPTPT